MSSTPVAPPQEEASFKYHAFVCHRRSDGAPTARWLRGQLQAYRLPRGILEKIAAVGAARDDAPRRLYLDTVYEGTARDYWTERLKPALEASEHLIVLWTPDASRRRSGDWDAVWEEIQYFRDRRHYEKVIVVLAKGDETQPSPAQLLENHPRIEIRRIPEPTWISRFLVPGAVRDEIVKIAGTLYGVPTELMPELHQEQRRRSLRRMTLAFAVTLAILIAMTSLFVSRNAALGQAKAALEEANHNLALALAGRAVVAARDKQPYKSGVFLAEARRIYPSSEWNAVSILVGPPIVTRSGVIRLGEAVRTFKFAPARNEIAVPLQDGIHLIDFSTSKTTAILPESAGHGRISFDNSGNRLIAGNGRNVKIWSLTNSTEKPVQLPAFDNEDGPRIAPSAFAVNPRKEQLAIGKSDGSVQVWDLGTKAYGSSFPTGSAEDVALLAFHPDGHRLAISHNNSSTVRILDTRTGAQIELEGGAFILTALQFSPDGKYLGVTGTDGLLKIWDVDTKEPAIVAQEHPGFEWTLDFSPRDSLVAAGGSDRLVRLWDTETRSIVARLDAHAGEVHAAAFGPDGSMIATAGGDNTIAFWKVDISALSGRTVEGGQFAFNGQRNQLALAASPGVIWADVSGLNPVEMRSRFAHELLGLPYTQQLTAGANPVAARIIDPQSGEISVTLEGNPLGSRHVTFSGSGKMLAGAHGNQVLLWDSSTGKLQKTVDGFDGDYILTAMSFSRSDRYLAASFDSWPQSTKGVLGIWDVNGPKAGLVQKVILGDASVRRLAFSPDEKFIAAELTNRHIEVWDLATGKSLALSTASVDSGFARAWLPDFTRVLFLESGGKMHLRRLMPPSEFSKTFGTENSGEGGLLVSPVGDVFAREIAGGNVEIWELGEQTLRATLPDAGRIGVFDPSGGFLMTYTSDGLLAFWNVRTGEETGTVRYGSVSDRPGDAAFNSDASILALARGDSSKLLYGIPVWDRSEAEMLSGFSLKGTSLVRLDDTSPRSIPLLDIPLAEFWRALSQAKVNLKSPEGRTDRQSAVARLRRWVKEHPEHPMRAKVSGYLEQLLPLPDMRPFFPPNYGGPVTAK